MGEYLSPKELTRLWNVRQTDTYYLINLGITDEFQHERLCVLKIILFISRLNPAVL